MTSTVKSPSGKVLHHRATMNTTPKENAEAKLVRIRKTQSDRLEENRESLKNANVKAFLQAIADAEGGGYDFKYGAVKGKKNDPWRFTDFSKHPGPGSGGKTTASGMYQITMDTWKDHGTTRMGLTDFTPETQDLIATDILRSLGVIEKIKLGDIAASMPQASTRWAALPQGPGKANKYPPQPYVTYDHFIEAYKNCGGKVQ